MADESGDKPVKPTLDQLGFMAANNMAAPLANKIYLIVNAGVAKLAFVEFPTDGTPGIPQGRAAVALNLNDLAALRDLINGTLGNGQEVKH